MRMYFTGIRSIADAEQAVSWGASAVGIKMGYEKNKVHPETARDIFFNLPVFISRVGIFSDEKRYNVMELITFCRLDTLHFIGKEQAEDLKRYSEHILKTFELKDINMIKDYDLQGVVINLQSVLSQNMELEMQANCPVIFSGSLTVTEWIDFCKKYHPYAVQLDFDMYNKKQIENILTFL